MRSYDQVHTHRRTPDNLVTQSVRKSVQDNGAAAADRRLTDTTSADRRLRIGNIERGPFHVDRNVQNCGWFVLIEAFGERQTIVLVIHPLLADGVADT